MGHPAVRMPCCIRSLSTVSVYKSQVSCQWTVSMSSVLYPSFNGSPPDPGPIKYHIKKIQPLNSMSVSLHRRKARAPEAQKHGKTYAQSVRGHQTLENVSSERHAAPTHRKTCIHIYLHTFIHIRRPPCGAPGCEDDLLYMYTVTVHCLNSVSSCHCLQYCSPPLMVPRRTRNPQNTFKKKVDLNLPGAPNTTKTDTGASGSPESSENVAPI